MKNEDKTRQSKEKDAWLQSHHIGRTFKGYTLLSISDRQRIRALLEASGISPEQYLQPKSAETTRADRAKTAISEKSGADAVSKNNVLIRSFPGHPLLLKKNYDLPARASLSTDIATVLSENRHQTIMLVENRYCFDNLETIFFKHRLFDENPLILFRGSPGVSTASLTLIRELGRDVFVYGDIDPSGLTIAESVPHAIGFIRPSFPKLQETLKTKHGYHQRFLKQMALLRQKTHPAWTQAIWAFVRQNACALPQELFHA